MVTGIHLHALFVCLKHCLSEEAATKDLCLFPQTVPVTFCLFEQKHYLNRLSLSQERKDYACVCNVMLVLFMSCSFLHFSWTLHCTGIFMTLQHTKLNLLTPVNIEINCFLYISHFIYAYTFLDKYHTIHLKSLTSSHNQRSCMIVYHNIYIPNGPLQ